MTPREQAGQPLVNEVLDRIHQLDALYFVEGDERLVPVHPFGERLDFRAEQLGAFSNVAAPPAGEFYSRSGFTSRRRRLAGLARPEQSTVSAALVPDAAGTDDWGMFHAFYFGEFGALCRRAERAELVNGRARGREGERLKRFGQHLVEVLLWARRRC